MQLTLEVEGEEKNTPVFAQIIPLSVARELNSHLLENSSVFIEDRKPFSLSRNYMIAGVMAERFWKNTGLNDIRLPLWTRMLEQLLDSESGIPKELSERELMMHSRHVLKNHTPYQSTILFKMPKQGVPE